MTKTQEIHADVMAEAKKLLNDIVKPDYVRSDALVFVFRALLARDTAARKDQARKDAEIARADGAERAGSLQADAAFRIATAIEATITGGGDE